MFYRQVSLYKGLPFDVCIPNAETIAAMREFEHDKQALPRYKRFEDYLHSIANLAKTSFTPVRK